MPHSSATRVRSARTGRVYSLDLGTSEFQQYLEPVPNAEGRNPLLEQMAEAERTGLGLQLPDWLKPYRGARLTREDCKNPWIIDHSAGFATNSSWCWYESTASPQVILRHYEAIILEQNFPVFHRSEFGHISAGRRNRAKSVSVSAHREGGKTTVGVCWAERRATKEAPAAKKIPPLRLEVAGWEDGETALRLRDRRSGQEYTVARSVITHDEEDESAELKSLRTAAGQRPPAEMPGWLPLYPDTQVRDSFNHPQGATIQGTCRAPFRKLEEFYVSSIRKHKLEVRSERSGEVLGDYWRVWEVAHTSSQTAANIEITGRSRCQLRLIHFKKPASR